MFFGMCLSQRKSTTNFGRSPFFRKEVAFFFGRDTKTHIYKKKIDEQKNRNFSLRIVNNSTTTTLPRRLSFVTWAREFSGQSCPPPHGWWSLEAARAMRRTFLVWGSAVRHDGRITDFIYKMLVLTSQTIGREILRGRAGAAGWRGSGGLLPQGRYRGGSCGEAAAGGEAAERAGGVCLVQFFGCGRPCVILQQFQLFFDVVVLLIQFIDRVLACRCTTETCPHSANCAADRRNSPGAVLGAGSWHARCCASTGAWSLWSCSDKFQRCDSGEVPQFQFMFCNETGTQGQTVELPQVQFLDKVFVTSTRPSVFLFMLFIDFGIQVGRANAVFTMSSSPLDDDDDGLGDDDDLLEFGAADEESKMEEVSDRGLSPWECGIFRAPSVRTDVERHFSGPSIVKSSLPSRAPAQ